MDKISTESIYNNLTIIYSFKHDTWLFTLRCGLTSYTIKQKWTRWTLIYFFVDEHSFNLFSSNSICSSAENWAKKIMYVLHQLLIISRGTFRKANRLLAHQHTISSVIACLTDRPIYKCLAKQRTSVTCLHLPTVFMLPLFSPSSLMHESRI